MDDVTYDMYWHETEPTTVGPPLDGDATCDVCIVGGGYTGLWAAHFIKQAEPSMSVRVLEAEFAGGGASGMNAGFVQMTAGKVLRRMLWYYGKEKAGGVYKSVARSILEIGRFCRQNGIDAQYENNGVLQVATDSKQLTRLELQVARAEKAGVASFRLLDKQHAQERIGSPSVLGALKVSGALINPYRLARGLARVIQEQGVLLHERTRAQTVEKVGGKWRITTPTGTITADEVVMATNALQGAFPELHARQMPVWNYLMVTEPLTGEQLARVPWPGREGVVNSLSFSTGARLTADNRVLWAGGLWYMFGDRDTDPRHRRNDDAFGKLAESFRGFFPDWKDVRFSHANGGLISWSHTFIPQFGRTESGMVYGHGYTGSGIAASHTGGKILRDLVLHRETEFTELAFVTVNQPKFLPGGFGAKGGEFFIWRQKVGDRLPLMVPRIRKLWQGGGSTTTAAAARKGTAAAAGDPRRARRRTQP